MYLNKLIRNNMYVIPTNISCLFFLFFKKTSLFGNWTKMYLLFSSLIYRSFDMKNRAPNNFQRFQRYILYVGVCPEKLVKNELVCSFP